MTVLARHLLLAALLLRALVPLGWMPGNAQLGEAAWIICTADGQIQHGVPGHDEAGKQHQQPCAFASAHVMAPPQAHAFAEPQLQVSAPDTGAATATVSLASAFTPQTPRAPPISA